MEGKVRATIDKVGGARNTKGEGGHMGSTLDVGRAGVIGYGIGGTGS